MKEFLQPGRYVDSAHPAVIEFPEELERKYRTGAGGIAVLRGARRHPLQPVPGFFEGGDVPGFRLSRCRRGLLRRQGRAARSLRARHRHPGARGLCRREKTTSPRPRCASAWERICSCTTAMPSCGSRANGSRRPGVQRSSCARRFGVKPLEFDGREDSIFHPFDEQDRRHMEYVRDRGCHADVPVAAIMQAFREHYPALYDLRSEAAKERFRLTPRELLEASFRGRGRRGRSPRDRSAAPAAAARWPHPGACRRQGGGLDGARRGTPLARRPEALRHRADALRARAAAGADTLGRGRAPGTGRSRRAGGARDARRRARAIKSVDLLLALISGGGSALLSLPSDGISIADLRTGHARPAAQRATIQEINTCAATLS